jgi:hypothetical protein
MPTYHKMGHDSKNLVDLPDLFQYAGAIYSPINCNEVDAGPRLQNPAKAVQISKPSSTHSSTCQL